MAVSQRQLFTVYLPLNTERNSFQKATHKGLYTSTHFGRVADWNCGKLRSYFILYSCLIRWRLSESLQSGWVWDCVLPRKAGLSSTRKNTLLVSKANYKLVQAEQMFFDVLIFVFFFYIECEASKLTVIIKISTFTSKSFFVIICVIFLTPSFIKELLSAKQK